MDLIELALSVDTKGLDKGINKLDNLTVAENKASTQAVKSGGLISKSFDDSSVSLDKASKSGTGLTSVMSGLGGIVAGLGLTSLATDAFNTYRSFESMNASLKTVTGSAEAAGKAFAEIKEFAKTTPYTLDQSVEGFQKLKALGLDPSMSALQSYGNTAAAMGKDLTQMIEAVADASTGEFERLKEFGIKSSSQGDQVSFTFQGITKTVGKNSAEIQAYLRAIGDTQFATAMSDQMETIDGKIANLADSYAALQIQFMQNGGAQAAEMVIKGLSSLIVSITENTKEWILIIGLLSASMIRNLVASVIQAIAQNALWIKSLYASTQATTVYTKSVGLMGVATVTTTAKVSAATIAMRGLSGVMALIGGPVGLFITAAATAFAYREEITELATGVKMSKEQEELRVKVLEDVKRLSTEAMGATNELAESKRKDAEASYQSAQAGLADLKVRAALARQRYESAKAAEAAENKQGLSIQYRSTENLDAATRAARNANNEYQAQLDLVKAIDKEMQNFGKNKVTIQGVSVETTQSTSAYKAPDLTSTEDSAKAAARALESIRTEQEKYNDTIAQAKEWRDNQIIGETEYNKLVAAADAALAKATATTTKASAAVKGLTYEQQQAIDASTRAQQANKLAQESLGKTDEEVRALELSYKDGYTPELARAQAQAEYAKKSQDELTASNQQAAAATQQAREATELAQLSLGKTDEQVRALTLSYKDGYTVEMAKAQAAAEFAKKAEEELEAAQIKEAQAARDAAEAQKEKAEALKKSAAEAVDASFAAQQLALDSMYQTEQQIEVLALMQTGKYSQAQAETIAKNHAIADSYKEIETLMTGLLNPSDSLIAKIEELNEAWKNGEIDAIAYADALEMTIETSEKVDAQAKKVAEELEKNTKLLSTDLVGSLNDALLSGDFKSLGDKLSEIFQDDVFGTILKDGLSDFGDKFTNSMKGIVNSLSGAFGGSNIFANVGDGLSTLFSSDTMKNAISGLDIGGAIDEAFGNSGIGSTIGGAIGSIWGPIGSTIGSALGSLAESAFGGDEYVSGQGVQLGYSYANGFEGQELTQMSEERSLWRGTKRWTEYDELDAETESSISSYFNTVEDTIAAQAALFGESSEDILSNFVVDSTNFWTGDSDINLENWASGITDNIGEIFGIVSDSIEDVSVDDMNLEDWAGIVTGEMYDAVFGSLLGHLQDEGEELADTVSRVISQISTVVTGFSAMGVSFDMTMVQLADMTDGLVEAAGSLDTLQTNMQSYYDLVFTSAEQTVLQQNLAKSAIDAFNDSLGLSGYAAIDTAEELKNYVDSLKLNTTAGQEAYAQAVALASSIETYSGSAEDAAERTAELAEELEGLATTSEAVGTLVDVLAETLYGSLDERYAIELARYTALKNGANDLRDAVLGFTDSVTDNKTSLADAQRNYNDLLKQAQSGDASVIPDLIAASETLKSTLSENYAGGAEASSGTALIAGQLEQVAALMDLQAGSEPIEPETIEATLTEADRALLADVLVSSLKETAIATGEDITDLMASNGIYLTSLATDLGIDLDKLRESGYEISKDEVNELVALSDKLGMNTLELTKELGITSSNIGKAISTNLESLPDVPDDIKSGLAPYLDAIEKSNDYTTIESVLGVTKDYIDSLPADIRQQLTAKLNEIIDTSELVSQNIDDLNVMTSEQLDNVADAYGINSASIEKAIDGSSDAMINGLTNMSKAYDTNTLTLAKELGINASTVSGAISKNLSSLPDVPDDIKEGLAPYLSAIENSNDYTTLESNIKKASGYINALPDGIKSQLNGQLNALNFSAATTIQSIESLEKLTEKELTDVANAYGVNSSSIIKAVDGSGSDMLSGLSKMASAYNVSTTTLSNKLGINASTVSKAISQNLASLPDVPDDIKSGLAPYLSAIEKSNDYTSLDNALASANDYINTLPEDIRSQLSSRLEAITKAASTTTQSITALNSMTSSQLSLLASSYGVNSQSITQAVNGSGASLISGLKSMASAYNSSALTIANKVGLNASTVAKAISTNLSSLPSLSNSIKSQLAPYLTAIESSNSYEDLETAINSASGFINTLPEDIKTQLNSQLDGIVSATNASTTAIKQIDTVSAADIQKIAASNNQSLYSYAQSVTQSIRAVEGISDDVTDSIEPYLTAINSATTWEELETSFNGLGGLINGLPDGIKTQLSSKFADIVASSGKVQQSVDGITTISEKELNEFADKADVNITDYAEAVAETIEKMDGLPQEIRDEIQPYLDAINATTTWDDMSSSFTNLNTYIASLPAQMQKAFDEQLEKTIMGIDKVEAAVDGIEGFTTPDLELLADTFGLDIEALRVANEALSKGDLAKIEALAQVVGTTPTKLADALSVSVESLSGVIVEQLAGIEDVPQGVKDELAKYIEKIEAATSVGDIDSTLADLNGFIDSLPEELSDGLTDNFTDIINAVDGTTAAVIGLNSELGKKIIDLADAATIDYTTYQENQNATVTDYDLTGIAKVASEIGISMGAVADVLGIGISQLSSSLADRIEGILQTDVEKYELEDDIYNISKAVTDQQLTNAINELESRMGGMMSTFQLNNELGIGMKYYNGFGVNTWQPHQAFQSYDVGSDYIQGDQMAQIHNGEAIFTASQSDGLRESVSAIMARVASEPTVTQPTTVNLNASTSKSEMIMQDLLDELKATKAEIKEMKDDQKIVSREINKNSKNTYRVIDRWEGLGLPKERV